MFSEEFLQRKYKSDIETAKKKKNKKPDTFSTNSALQRYRIKTYSKERPSVQTFTLQSDDNICAPIPINKYYTRYYL